MGRRSRPAPPVIDSAGVWAGVRHLGVFVRGLDGSIHLKGGPIVFAHGLTALVFDPVHPSDADHAHQVYSSGEAVAILGFIGRPRPGAPEPATVAPKRTRGRSL